MYDHGRQWRRFCSVILFLFYRYAPQPVEHYRCLHAKKGILKCQELTGEDLQDFNNKFYAEAKKQYQDDFIMKYISVKRKTGTRKRREVLQNKRRNRIDCETTFYIRRTNKTIVRVCRYLFLKALGGIGRRRVEGIAKHLYAHGKSRPEKRGGDKRSVKYGGRRDAVKTFIRNLKGRESHYGRGQSKKIYLPADLMSLKNVWRMYERQNPEFSVKYDYFRRIFKRDFRIGFGSPKTDTCSFCERHRHKIKAEQNPRNNNMLMAQYVIHKRRAKAFYSLLNESRDGLKTFCFDHQQNQVLPKVPDKQAYYSRQLYIYNFTMVEQKIDMSQ